MSAIERKMEDVILLKNVISEDFLGEGVPLDSTEKPLIMKVYGSCVYSQKEEAMDRRPARSKFRMCECVMYL